MTIEEQEDAKKMKWGREKAEELLAEAEEVIISKGRKQLTFSMSDEPDLEEIIPLMLGRTGNLRAPTFRQGKTLVVGFNEALYLSLFPNE